jgi:multiple sugar transport system permease protein
MQKATAAKKRPFGAAVKKVFRDNGAGWLFSLPLTCGLLIFTLYPVSQALAYSFYDFNGVNEALPVGFGNYIAAFTADKEFYKVLANTFLFAAVSVPLGLVLSYLLAVLVNKKLKGMHVFRTLFYLPVVIPGITSARLWYDMMGYPNGVLNEILRLFGVGPFTFFSVAGTSMVSMYVMGVWGVGGGMVLWLAAFKNIPASMYEAAQIEGAGKVRQFFSITIPLSTAMIFYNIVVGVIGALQSNATMIFAVRGGRGVDDSIYLMSVKIYREAFNSWKLGYSAALSWILFVFIGALTFVMFKTNKWVFTGADY